MPKYSYRARDESGKSVSGTLEAPNTDSLVSKLRKQKYFVTSVIEKTPTAAIDDFFMRFTKVRLNDLVMFNFQLSNMISAGIPLPTALMSLVEQTENQKLRNAIIKVNEDIKEGQTFSDSLKKHPDIFPTLFINMVHAGEVAGNLDEILVRLSSFMERESELRSKITTALFYPVILAVVGTLVIILIIVTILPSFAKIFIESNVPLPLPTLVLYNANLYIRAYWRQAIVTIIGLDLLFNWYKKTPSGKYYVDSAMLLLPVWGKVIRESTISRLSRTLGSLISTGVPMLQALEVTEQTIDNAIISRVLKKVYASVSKGETISAPLRESGQFPAMAIHMVAVGEETGALDTMLNKVADYFDLATEYSVKKITALLEPMFLVIIGGAVGFIFAAILLPIFNMVKTLHQ